MVPADRVVAFGAARAGEDEAFAGAEAVPDDGEKAAEAAAEAGEPEDGEPPEDVGEQAVAGLELDGGEWSTNEACTKFTGFGVGV